MSIIKKSQVGWARYFACNGLHGSVGRKKTLPTLLKAAGVTLAENPTDIGKRIFECLD